MENNGRQTSYLLKTSITSRIAESILASNVEDFRVAEEFMFVTKNEVRHNKEDFVIFIKNLFFYTYKHKCIISVHEVQYDYCR